MPLDLARLTGLGQVTGELARAEDLETVTEIVTRHAADVLGAAVALLAVREGDVMRSLGLKGSPVDPRLLQRTFGLDENIPICDAVRLGQPVVLLGSAAVAERYPFLASDVDRSVVVHPLHVMGSEAFGVIALRFDGEGSRPDPHELQLIEVVATTCSLTLTRIETQRQNLDRARKLEILAEASEALASSLDYRETLVTVANLAVPGFADWCGVEMLEDGRLRTLAIANTDPANVAHAHEVNARDPALPDSRSGSYHVARTGLSELYETFPDDADEITGLAPGRIPLIRALKVRSAIVVPLVVRDKVFGVLSFLCSTVSPPYTVEDVTFAETLARRAAMAIDNADLFSQTQHAAHELQRALLPERLPELPGWDVAAVYRPSGRSDVGGDFYDVIPLPNGRIAVVIGDVMGRGVDSAAASHHLHAAVRAYIALDSDPASVSSGLDRLMELYGAMPLVTLVYLLLDPAHDSVDLLVAGHLPPMLIARDGSRRFLTEAGWPAFGVGPQPRRSARVDFRAGDALLLYTDGLIERRFEDIDASLNRLDSAVAGLSLDDLGDFLTSLADHTPDPEQDDDIAILALRRRPG